MHGLREESDGAEQEISADIFRCVHLTLFIYGRVVKLYPVRYPVLASEADRNRLNWHPQRKVCRTSHSTLPQAGSQGKTALVRGFHRITSWLEVCAPIRNGCPVPHSGTGRYKFNGNTLVATIVAHSLKAVPRNRNLALQIQGRRRRLAV